jgi:hypothetical protein
MSRASLQACARPRGFKLRYVPGRMRRLREVSTRLPPNRLLICSLWRRAREALNLLLIKDETGKARPARELFHFEELYPGSKLTRLENRRIPDGNTQNIPASGRAVFPAITT